MTLRRLFVIHLWMFVALSSGMFTYLRFFEPAALVYLGLPFKVAGPARQGESVQMMVNRCNNSNKPLGYELSRYLRNNETGLITILPSGRIPELSPGCIAAISASNVIPAGTQPGKRYVVGGEAEVKGTIRTVYVHWESEEFEVLQ